MVKIDAEIQGNGDTKNELSPSHNIIPHICNANKLLNGRYYLHNLIAKSTYSRVFLASDLVNRCQKYVVKQLCFNLCPIKEKQTRMLMFEQEAEVLKKLAGRHNQICQFYDYFKDSDGLYLVQEWVRGITLEQKLLKQQKLSESETKSILINLLPVLECIHSLGIIHCDIKPNNIILRKEDNLPVLIDFGITQEVGTCQSPKLIAGTPGYMSIEQAMGCTTYNNDLYSLGLTAIYLLTGHSPQTREFEINRSSFEQQAKTIFSYNLMAVIDRAITPDYGQRFSSAKDMRLALQSSKEKSRLTQIATNKLKYSLYALLYLTIGIQIVANVYLSWRYLTTKIDERPPINFLDLPQAKLPFLTTDDDVKPTIFKTPNEIPNNVEITNNALQAVIFIPGTSEINILQALGEPVWRKPGFWANSIAWNYKNVVLEGIDLGYIFDSQTKKLRQAEVAVPPSTKFATVRSIFNSLLNTKPLTDDIEQGLQAVYQRQKATYNFTVGNLRGIIQRNHKDRIYMAVWEADFH
ncbi:serine/threonine-protein kinase [Pleurocapsa sp. PCC 7319]|uniref:serine/threonine protein kinase n=1 Tax=Pleurocapsa sp. PCC 7319 TaxID=118161 RepID=UPI00035E7175|nr:serine/threonine-protein kinase [Pleurocapsa sp. PCC 7319]